MPTITYQIERAAHVKDEMAVHFQSHWDEIASNKHIRPFDPDIELRLRVESLGKLVLATARESERLIGYIMWWVVNDPQSKHQLTAETDIYYVEERPTRALIMARMAKFSLEHLYSLGVVTPRPRTKLKLLGKGRGAGRIWEALGFQPFEIIYTLKPPSGDASLSDSEAPVCPSSRTPSQA